MKPKILSLINQQITHEYYSYFVYMALSTFFERCGLFGFEKWALKSAGEELNHARKFMEYLQDKSQMVEFSAIPAPDCNCNTVLEALDLALKHEQRVTAWISDIVAATSAERDYTTFAFAQFFVLEQIEEEKKVADLIARVTVAGDDAIVVDHELLD